MALWSGSASSLGPCTDRGVRTPAITEILTNRDVIAVDQDRDGKQGTRTWAAGDLDIWTRPLASGDMAVAVFNRGSAPASATIRWADLKIGVRGATALNLWAHTSVE